MCDLEVERKNATTRERLPFSAWAAALGKILKIPGIDVRPRQNTLERTPRGIERRPWTTPTQIEFRDHAVPVIHFKIVATIPSDACTVLAILASETMQRRKAWGIEHQMSIVPVPTRLFQIGCFRR